MSARCWIDSNPHERQHFVFPGVKVEFGLAGSERVGGGALLLGPFNTPLPWWERQAHEKKSIRSNKQGLKHGVLRTDQWRGKESEQTETKTARVALRSALRCTAVSSWSLPCGYICGYSKTMKCSATQVMCSLYLY